jgi:hypothetical protein
MKTLLLTLILASSSYLSTCQKDNNHSTRQNPQNTTNETPVSVPDTGSTFLLLLVSMGVLTTVYILRSKREKKLLK